MADIKELGIVRKTVASLWEVISSYVKGQIAKIPFDRKPGWDSSRK